LYESYLYNDRLWYRILEQKVLKITTVLIQKEWDRTKRLLQSLVPPFSHNYEWVADETVRLPFSRNRIVRIHVDQIKRFPSNSKPWIVPIDVVDVVTNQTKRVRWMYKAEDLRKDRLAQVSMVLIKSQCPDLNFTTSNILPLNESSGWIELFDDATTLYDIRHRRSSTLQNYIHSKNMHRTVQDIRNEFVRSCAGSCILCYVLGVGDRHLENILVLHSGELVHVDFSFLLGADPKLERMEMRITPDMLEMMGGTHSPEYAMFKQLCSFAYSCVRRETSFWYTFIENSQILNSTGKNALQNHISQRLVPGEHDIEAELQIREIVDQSSNSWQAEFVDWAHSVFRFEA